MKIVAIIVRGRSVSYAMSRHKCPKWAKEIEINKIMTKKMSKREKLMRNENLPSLPSGRSTTHEI